MEDKKISEKEVENAILEYLEWLPDGFFWKQPTVGVYDERKGVYRRSFNKYVITGISDIIGVYKGQCVAIEVKAPSRKNNVSESQKRFIENIKANGGIAFVAWSVDQVKERLNELKDV